MAGVLGALIPLRLNIATMVSILLVVVAGAIVVNDQITGRSAALGEAKASFRNHNENIRLELEALNGPVETVVEGTAETLSLLPDESIITTDSVRLFSRRLADTDLIYALYYGDKQGNFVISGKLYDLVPPDAGPAYFAWIIKRPTQDDYQQTVLELDAEYQVLSTDHDQNYGYDPRTRPWFNPAMESDQAVATPPYVFFEGNTVAYTLSARTVDGQGVVGGDVALGTVSDALRSGRATPSSLAVLFDDTTAVMAAADDADVLDLSGSSGVTQHTLASTSKPSYVALSKLFESGERQGVFQTSAGGKDWVISISRLSFGRGRHVNMGVLAPSDEVYAEVNERMRRNLIIAGIGIGVGLIVAWLFAQGISKPIRNLTNEAFQMRSFDLSDRPQVRSRIVEVHRLSLAVQTLKRSMADFGRYVPTQLVRRLVAGDMTAEIGGERRELTLLFTDIADFTSISEGMEPTMLMHEMSEYLGEASSALIEHGATIDKYIGDAIMAMWNAPVHQDNHVELACRAALDTAAVINSLNQRRTAKGRPPFYTRFGLHVGEAIVGNVGSDERMNYTALGETVNLASRLEGLNKQLGTQILVSEAVMGALPEEFVTRPVDMVRPKGTTQPVRVFELISPDQYPEGEGETAHLESWRACYTSYTERRWDDAVAYFDRHIQDFPNDATAKVLRARAASYRDLPPPEDWDGVFEAQTK